jgi:hypothetical protein
VIDLYYYIYIHILHCYILICRNVSFVPLLSHSPSHMFCMYHNDMNITCIRRWIRVRGTGTCCTAACATPPGPWATAMGTPSSRSTTAQTAPSVSGAVVLCTCAVCMGCCAMCMGCVRVLCVCAVVLCVLAVYMCCVYVVLCCICAQCVKAFSVQCASTVCVCVFVKRHTSFA